LFIFLSVFSTNKGLHNSVYFQPMTVFKMWCAQRRYKGDGVRKSSRLSRRTSHYSHCRHDQTQQQHQHNVVQEWNRVTGNLASSLTVADAVYKNCWLSGHIWFFVGRCIAQLL